VLTPSGPIEKNSYSYSCSQTKTDSMAPKPIAFLPSINTINVPVGEVLSIKFDEKILKGKSGFVTIYQNNILKESISIEDSQIVINDSSVIITPNSYFKYNSRLAIALDNGCFIDFSSNKMNRIDTSNWIFVTENKLSNYDVVTFKRVGVYPNPAHNIIRLPFNGGESNVAILNSIGQPMNFVIVNKLNQELEIDISKISNGLYSLYLNNRFYQMIFKE
jgi:hypothetical protein